MLSFKSIFNYIKDNHHRLVHRSFSEVGFHFFFVLIIATAISLGIYQLSLVSFNETPNLISVSRAQISNYAVLDDFESGMRKGPSGTEDLWIKEVGLNPNQNISVVNHDGSNRLRVEVLSPGLVQNSSLRVRFYPNTLIGGNRYPYTEGFTRSYIQSGTWSPTMNRLEFLAKCDVSIPYNARQNTDLGTYIKSFIPTVDPDIQGSHWYNQMGNTIYANQWIKHVLFWNPPANNYTSGSTEYSSDPLFNGPLALNPPEHYWNGLTTFYINHFTDPPSYPFNCYYDDFIFYEDSFKPDEKIKNVAATYDGSRYAVTFGGKKNTPQEYYELRYSNQSMKVNGWMSGTVFATPLSMGSAYTQVEVKTPPMPKSASTMYFGIKAASHPDFVEVVLPAIGSAVPPSPPPPPPTPTPTPTPTVSAPSPTPSSLTPTPTPTPSVPLPPGPVPPSPPGPQPPPQQPPPPAGPGTQSINVPPGINFGINDILTFGETVGGFLMVLGGILIGVYIVGTGIVYLTAGSNPQRITSAKGMLKSAIIAGLIIFGAGVIISTVGTFSQNPLQFFN